MRSHAHIVVIGGGVVGLTAAWKVAARGASVCLLGTPDGVKTLTF